MKVNKEIEKTPIVKFYNINDNDHKLLKRVVITCKYNNKWVYCRAKGRKTWEIPGGKIEINENVFDAAKRELYEETGAIKVEIKPICLFFVSQPAMLCYVDIYEFDKELKYEIEEIDFFDEEPNNLTYPEIHSELFKKAQEFLNF